MFSQGYINQTNRKNMRPITNPKELPKFLVCNEVPEKQWSWNKHLPMPWRVGEIVKVREAEVQKHDTKYDSTLHPKVKPYTDEEFSERFVRILRKDANGKFTIPQVGEWMQFELLKNIKQIKK